VIQSLKRSLSRAEETAILSLSKADPMLAKSPRLLFRNFSVAFESTDLEVIGGQQVLRQILAKWNYDSNKWEMDRKNYEARRFVRVNFTDATDASKFFRKALMTFISAVCAGPSGHARPPIRNLPRPSYWKGSTNDGGYWPAELPGLVVWDFNIPPQQAADELLGRVLARLGCLRADLPLFLDTQVICKPIKQISGALITRIKVFAHQSNTATTIATGLNGVVDKEVTSSLFPSGCALCTRKGHTIWECPLPKIRIRLRKPINVAFKSHIREWFGTMPSVGLTRVLVYTCRECK
jgi:hypothetical protein